MKILARNRQGDHHPILTLTAENKTEGEQLKHVLDDLVIAQRMGMEYGLANGGYPPCGCSTHHYALDSISVSVLLGQR